MNDQRLIWQHAQNIEPGLFRSAVPRLEFLLNQIAKRSRDDSPTVLNISVGDGHFERQAKLRGWNIHSLDPDPESMERLANEGIPSHVGVIEKLPMAESSYDFVVASEVLEHLTDDQRTVGCAEIVRILKPDGWFLGTAPYCEDLSLRQCVCPQCGLVYHQYGHMASFDFTDIAAMLEQEFVIERTGRSAFVAFRGRSTAGKFKSLLRMLLGRLGQQIAVPRLYWIARKHRPAT